MNGRIRNIKSPAVVTKSTAVAGYLKTFELASVRLANTAITAYQHLLFAYSESFIHIEPNFTRQDI